MLLASIEPYVTAILVGFIWTVQLVQYPIFRAVPFESFQDFHQAHMKRISMLVMPLMIIEGILASARVFFGSLDVWSILSFSLLLLVWLSTFFIQVPLHNRLERGYSQPVIQRLIRSNWIRTIAWSLRLVVLIVIES